MFDFDCRIVFKLYIRRDKIGGQKKYIISSYDSILLLEAVVLYLYAYIGVMLKGHAKMFFFLP